MPSTSTGPGSSSPATSCSWRSSRCWPSRSGLRRGPESITFRDGQASTRGGSMARTPLAQAVEDAVAKIADEEARTTRRGLLRGAGAAIAGSGVVGALARPAWAHAAKPASSARIVVVGAGLAGLTAAYRLQQAGYAAQVYEASGRIGGRCWTGRGDFLEGQIYEHGGELIDSNHIQIKQLAQELGLTLDNLYQAETKGTEQLGYFFGQPYSFTQMTNDLK